MADFSIQPIVTGLINPANTAGETAALAENSPSFGSVLNQSINTVARMQQEADVQAAQLTAGESKDIHGTMIAMQKAEISMSLMMEVRNKMVETYREIMRMQV